MGPQGVRRGPDLKVGPPEWVSWCLMTRYI